MRKASEILKAIFDDEHIRITERYASLFDGWRKIVGEDIAAHSLVRDIDGKTLIVEADHPGWLQMIRLKERKILSSLRRKYPELEIRSIRIFVEQGRAQKPDSTSFHQSAPDDKTAKSDTNESAAGNDRRQRRKKGSEETGESDRREFEQALQRLRTLGRGTEERES